MTRINNLSFGKLKKHQFHSLPVLSTSIQQQNWLQENFITCFNILENKSTLSKEPRYQEHSCPGCTTQNKTEESLIIHCKSNQPSYSLHPFYADLHDRTFLARFQCVTFFPCSVLFMLFLYKPFTCKNLSSLNVCQIPFMSEAVWSNLGEGRFLLTGFYCIILLLSLTQK